MAGVAIPTLALPDIRDGGGVGLKDSGLRSQLLPSSKHIPTSSPRQPSLPNDNDIEGVKQDPNTVNYAKMPLRDYDGTCPQARLAALGMPQRGVEDMIRIDRLNEESILLNLQRRYEEDLIYTYTGSILVSVNPYKHMPIYTTQYVKEYIGKRLGSRPPHIYATANAAYTALTASKRNQAVIISGESGAGKTEATKLTMQFLAQCTNKHSEVERKILDANPVLEAFGNAATVRNNNSSRFGRFIEIRFNSACNAIEGARITNYLLEKSRIVKQTQGERNYHAFYMFLAGATEEEKKKYFLKEAKDYHYLNQSDVYTLPNVDDKLDWERMRLAMDGLGLSSEDQGNVLSLLAAILCLGNTVFVPGEKDQTKIADESVLEMASTLLGVQAPLLKDALLTRIIAVGSEKLVKPLTLDEATDARDTLAKTLYDRLFGWLLEQINNSIKGTFTEQSPFIGILDIFGFENFAENSFEQLCINFTNEALQQHFNNHIFMLEQKEYEAQGLKNWNAITFNDNQKCLDLIEGTTPPGILQLLDEEARFPKGSDDSFLAKVTNNHKKNAHFETPRLRGRSPSFIVRHYAGDVMYQAPGFLDKNRDPLGPLIIGCFKSSTFALLRHLFPEDVSAPRAGRNAPKTIGIAFRMQLKTLMELLTQTEPHYIRCIKPNMFKIQRCFDAALVFHQLSYAGMMETIKIRQSGFPIRETFERFWKSYRILVKRTRMVLTPGGLMGCADYGAGCRRLVEDLLEENSGLLLPDQYFIGSSKVLLKDDQFSILDLARKAALKDFGHVLFRAMRAHHDRQLFLRKRRAASTINKAFRAYRARSRYVKAKRAALKIQTWYRMMTLRRKYLKIKKSILVIQTRSRMVRLRRPFKAKLIEHMTERKRLAALSVPPAVATAPVGASAADPPISRHPERPSIDHRPREPAQPEGAPAGPPLNTPTLAEEEQARPQRRGAGVDPSAATIRRLEEELRERDRTIAQMQAELTAMRMALVLVSQSPRTDAPGSPHPLATLPSSPLAPSPLGIASAVPTPPAPPAAPAAAPPAPLPRALPAAPPPGPPPAPLPPNSPSAPAAPVPPPAPAPGPPPAPLPREPPSAPAAPAPPAPPSAPLPRNPPSAPAAPASPPAPLPRDPPSASAAPAPPPPAPAPGPPPAPLPRNPLSAPAAPLPPPASGPPPPPPAPLPRNPPSAPAAPAPPPPAPSPRIPPPPSGPAAPSPPAAGPGGSGPPPPPPPPCASAPMAWRRK